MLAVRSVSGLWDHSLLTTGSLLSGACAGQELSAGGGVGDDSTPPAVMVMLAVFPASSVTLTTAVPADFTTRT